MSQFPLYTSLNKNIVEKDLTLLQKKDMVDKITKNQDIHELLYALIKTYYIENNGNYFAIPYRGKLNDEKIDFDLEDFPKKLKQILYKFITLHIKNKN